MNRAQIKEIFLEHGFTVKEGQSDLKEYVYQAAEALLQKATGYQQVGYMRWQNGSAEYVSVKRLETPLDSEWHVVFIAAEQPATQQAPVAGARCKIIDNCKSCQHSAGRQSCMLANRAFEGRERPPTPPDWCPLPLCNAPQPTENLRCKSTQKRLATLWGYVKKEPDHFRDATQMVPTRQPLTEEQIKAAVRHLYGSDAIAAMAVTGDIETARAVEFAHGITGGQQ